MNLLLLKPEQIQANQTVQVTGRAVSHMKDVLRSAPGDTLSVGVLNGNTGTATLETLGPQHALLRVQALDTPPPPTLPVKLLLGLPRPRMLQRLLQTVCTMGVEEIHLLQTARVEKSFWQTPLLVEDAIEAQLVLGLEQAKATQMPKVFFHKRWRPFLEDTLPALLPGTARFVAHPGYPSAPTPSTDRQPTLLVIGPEGGLIEQEVHALQSLDFTPFSLGSRILKVETAVPVALSHLFGAV